MSRHSGILLHPTSFPGPYGIGDLGPEAYRFVEWLAASGQTIWQTLALGPTGYGDSPYASFSAFAGNPLLISPARLLEDGDLEPADLEDLPRFPPDRVDFGWVVQWKDKLLQRAAANFFSSGGEEVRRGFDEFCETNAGWLDDYALFMALKAAHGMALWTSWKSGVSHHLPEALFHWRDHHEDEVNHHKYLQFRFFSQWLELKQYANSLGIRIMGDVPIFVAHDSADVWAHRDLFHLDHGGNPTAVAGVPPDYFSKTGQRWGNPLYRWDVMAGRDYDWWVERINHTFTTVDLLRIDHFRGFEAYWEVPASEPTAVKGRWVKGPGEELFNRIFEVLGPLPIIAEDLGVITPEVDALREQFDFPGMGVLQFAFDEGGAENRFLPFNHTRRMVVYTGTHDNDTTLGWFRSMPSRIRRKVRQYLGTSGRDICRDFIRLALGSVADYCIIPLQDVLGLGPEARMNLPGRASGNWQWRYSAGVLDDELAAGLREQVEMFGRLPD